MLITAGPSHEPIDAVRFVGNRSSGRLGTALALAAAAAGWDVMLLLGPTGLMVDDSRIRVRRFRTAADLESLLAEEFPGAAGGNRVDVLVMAAAVADYRPVKAGGSPVTPGGSTKLRRSDERLVLEFEPTPDLLAGCSARRKPGQVIVGFALEPRAELAASARAKLERKGLDLIVANPLETMDSPTIEAVVYGRDGRSVATPGLMSKDSFAPWLLEVIGGGMDGGAGVAR